MSKNKASLKSKIYRKCHYIIFGKLKLKDKLSSFYPCVKHASRKKTDENADLSGLYFTQIPNDGAGIGHQLANYISGYHYARVFGLKHAAVHFSDKKWDEFFGFYLEGDTVEELKKKGYRTVTLPYFDEDKDKEFVTRIISSYAGEKIVFKTELDQFFKNQYEEIPGIKALFEAAPKRCDDKTDFDNEKINLAVHIRRGDIRPEESKDFAVTDKRWMNSEYYENVLEGVCGCLSKEQRDKLEIYLFSQGNPDEYKAFERFGHINYRMDTDPVKSFLCMIRADILVTSKSSFSYKPALLSDGVRICPAEFWHGYPDNEKWILADETGNLLSDGNKVLSVIK